MSSSLLAEYAANTASSRGRIHQESSPGYRGEFQRDRDRIVHSAAFRRLEYKTQVFVNHEGDMFRTRLTHSIEVAQIARTVARILHLNEELTEAISLAHDLGHTPFGHAGQDALNLCMKPYGGFEHNLQSLRIVDHLEEKYAAFEGLNLTFETREGILKHCSEEDAGSIGPVAERFINGGHPSLEAQVADVCDGIAYNSHDVDDGLRAGLVDIADLREVALFREAHDEVRSEWPDLPLRRTIHEVIRRLINSQVVDLIETSQDRIRQHAPADIESVRSADRMLIGFSTAMLEQHLELKTFLRRNLYRHYRVHRMSLKAQRVISRLFEAFMDDVRILPPEYQKQAMQQRQNTGESGLARTVTDYIAGMTDRYAISEYERVFNPVHLT